MRLKEGQVLGDNDDLAQWVRLEVLMCQDVALQELQDSRHSCHFETECHKNLALLLEDGLPCKPVMPDSNHNRLHEERCDVLELRGEEHACDSNQVQLRQVE